MFYEFFNTVKCQDIEIFSLVLSQNMFKFPSLEGCHSIILYVIQFIMYFFRWNRCKTKLFLSLGMFSNFYFTQNSWLSFSQIMEKFLWFKADCWKQTFLFNFYTQRSNLRKTYNLTFFFLLISQIISYFKIPFRIFFCIFI